MRLTRLLFTAAIVLATASPALADVTVFLGGTTTPEMRAARGFSVGVGFVFVGFEFEYSGSSEDVIEGAPLLRTGMGNVLLQPPMIHGFQPYFTTGMAATARSSDPSRKHSSA